MLHGTIAKWYYMFNGTTSNMVLHVTLYYMLNCTKFYSVCGINIIKLTLYYMLLCNTCYMLKIPTETENLNQFPTNTIIRS